MSLNLPLHLWIEFKNKVELQTALGRNLYYLKMSDLAGVLENYLFKKKKKGEKKAVFSAKKL